MNTKTLQELYAESLKRGVEGLLENEDSVPGVNFEDKYNFISMVAYEFSKIRFKNQRSE